MSRAHKCGTLLLYGTRIGNLFLQDIRLHILPGDLFIREDDEALHDIPQFTYVARPVVLLQCFYCWWFNLFDWLFIVVADVLHKMRDQGRNIITPCIQRWHLYQYHTQAVVQIEPEFFGFHLFHQVLIGGRQYPYIHFYFFFPTNTCYLPFLQSTQHFWPVHRGSYPLSHPGTVYRHWLAQTCLSAV